MLLIKNRKARHDYDIGKTMIAGLVLTGPEVKSLRQKAGSLQGSYVKIIGEEAWLINAQINPYQYARQNQDYDPKRTRKLLLTKKQIHQLIAASDHKKQQLVPLAFVLINNHIKLELGIGKSQKEYQKKQRQKKRDLERSMAKRFKQSQLKI
jgi:SsrA-binding protein